MISTSTAADVARGVSRLLLEDGYSPILEFTLPNGRRLDVAAIGPGIGVCCYEVGEEVAKQFGHDARTHLDLMQENRKQLEAAGVPSEKIEALGVCTFCDAERFFSYRRDQKDAGRMTSYIAIKTEIMPR